MAEVVFKAGEIIAVKLREGEETRSLCLLMVSQHVIEKEVD